MYGHSYTIYHARTWAEGQTTEEIEAEIERCERKTSTHTFKWNEVGNAEDTRDRSAELRVILKDRAKT